jgi:hypothetical protein
MYISYWHTVQTTYFTDTEEYIILNKFHENIVQQ